MNTALSGLNEESLSGLAVELGNVLKARGWKVTAAESCTGGGVSYVLTSVPGSSDWFEEGFVTYANSVKQKRLDVSLEALNTDGAVSERVVKAMAKGAKRESGADCSLAVSGIAGPGGGTVGKPVGTVWFGWSVGDHLTAEKKVFSGDRRSIRLQAIQFALEALIKRLAL